MGNICSKSANKDENFSSPGQRLGTSADAPPRPVPVPQAVKQQQQRPFETTSGRPLGAADGRTSPNDARSAAARAAEERANAATTKPSGRLGEKLAAQKRQTQNQTLNAGSQQERLARTADENATNRNWN